MYFDVVKSVVGVETGPLEVSFLLPAVVSTLWVSFLFVMVLHTIQKQVTLLYWGILCLWINKSVYLPSLYLIPWNNLPISLDMVLDHFGFSSPFIWCLYSWALPVSGKMTAFISTVCMVTLPVVIFFEHPILSCLEHRLHGGLVGQNLSKWHSCGHMFGHEIVALEASGPCIFYLYQWYFDGVSIIWLIVWWHNIYVIRDDMRHCLGCLP